MKIWEVRRQRCCFTLSLSLKCNLALSIYLLKMSTKELTLACRTDIIIFIITCCITLVVIVVIVVVVVVVVVVVIAVFIISVAFIVFVVVVFVAVCTVTVFPWWGNVDLSIK